MTILFPVKIVYNIYKQEKAEENGILNFEWDEDKNQLNLKKHGIDFEIAMLVFNDLQRIEIYDMEHSINEDRYNTIGMVNDILFVVYTERKVTLDRNQKPTKEQIKQIEEAAKKKIVFDEDSPELTPAMEKAFRLAAKNRNTQKKANIS